MYTFGPKRLEYLERVQMFTVAHAKLVQKDPLPGCEQRTFLLQGKKRWHDTTCLSKQLRA